MRERDEVPDSFIVEIWHESWACSGTDGVGRKVTNFSSYVSNRWIKRKNSKAERETRRIEKNANTNQTRQKCRPDRNAGTYNEGSSAMYNAAVK